MIVVKLKGGLGNQLFEYAFARAIQEKLGDTSLILDITDFKYDKQGRNYSLKHFLLNNNVKTTNSQKYNFFYERRNNPILKIGTKFFPNVQYNILKRFGIYIWESVEYKDVKINPRHGCVLLSGIWQGFDYFKQSQEVIKKELKVSEPISDSNKRILNNIQQVESVCVHIRRTDFISSKNIYVNLDNEYYLQGMLYIEQEIENPIYFIFSDDIDGVKKEFNFGERTVIFIEENNMDFEELRLMYSCKHFIIANSTFSWWASFLSENEKKLIVAPKDWYQDKRDVSNLLMEKWKLIERSGDV